jgi:hypothetical protein
MANKTGVDEFIRANMPSDLSTRRPGLAPRILLSVVIPGRALRRRDKERSFSSYHGFCVVRVCRSVP